MSYILDALKKSEKERQRGAVPDLLTMQDVALHDRKKRKTWPYVLAVASVLCISLSAWLMTGKANREAGDTNIVMAGKSVAEGPAAAGNGQKQQASIQDNDTKGADFVQAKIEGVRTAPPASARSEERVRVKDELKAEKRTPASGAAREAPAGVAALSAQPVPTAVKTEPAVSSPSVSAAPTAVHDDPPPVPGKIYRSGELPASVRQNIPPINMSIFMYSEDPASRMVRINGQTYREGQSLGEGLKLEEIRPDGVVVNYRNYRLHLGQKP
jgi:general secretion pathway protein B